MNRKNCLIVGYGAAARSTVFGIRKNWENASIFVTGRNIEKAVEFARKFKSFNVTPIINTYEVNPFLIVSTLPSKAEIDLPVQCKSGKYSMDSAYPDSEMSAVAEKHDCRIIRGEQWLINQAVESFELFAGKKLSHSEISDINITNKKTYKNIILTGISGSGKTKIGKLIAEKLNFKHFDIDSIIETDELQTIPEIFSQKGEPYFRNAEKSVLEKVSQIPNCVISLGGGTLSNKALSENLLSNSLVVWLFSPLAQCLKRINFDDKPLLKSNPKANAEDLFKVRKKSYFKYADVIVPNMGNIEDTIENLLSLDFPSVILKDF